MDFDKRTWREDVTAFAETAGAAGLPVTIERSRSGSGAHAWFFFSAPVEASVARRMGCHLITETMNRRHEVAMSSYDRLFPNQDTLPRGGFGNLIALPLQHEPSSGRQPRTALTGITLPDTVRAVLAQRLFIGKAGLPSLLLSQLKHLAAFQNPEFYKKQRMRLSTALVPRVIACIVEDVVEALSQGRAPILLTERKDHLELLVAQLREHVAEIVTLHGGMSAKQRRDATHQLASPAGPSGRLVAATGRYIGEGFDDPRLDTVFLAMPVSWKGTLIQYSGRLHRYSPGKLSATKEQMKIFVGSSATHGWLLPP